MAERRMFAKTIVDSDAFLDMPQSTQLLYFHLSMRADDDGFINNPKAIMRNTKCNEDDLKLLAFKKFIIPFESGIVVIKHWKIHNYIAKDRYKETKYKEERATLSLDENNAYTECIQPVYEMDTQVRLGKNSIDYINNVNNINIINNKNIDNKDIDSNTDDADFEKAWIKTFDKYPKKRREVTAKQYWVKRILAVNETDRKQLAIDIYQAMLLYLELYKKDHPEDVKCDYVPKLEEWLEQDCDYWIRQLERVRAEND